MGTSGTTHFEEEITGLSFLSEMFALMLVDIVICACLFLADSYEDIYVTSILGKSISMIFLVIGAIIPMITTLGILNAFIIIVWWFEWWMLRCILVVSG